MNAVTLAGSGLSARIRPYVDQRKYGADVFDAVIANGHIRHRAYGAAVFLIFRTEEDGVTVLAESSPRIFKDVAFEQNALSILQLKQVLHDERPAGRASDKARFSGLPDQWFEKMIAANLDVSWRCRGRSAAEQDVFTRGLKKIVYDFEWAAGRVATTGPE